MCCAGAVVGFVSFVDMYDAQATYNSALLPAAAVTAGATGSAQLVISLDGTSALVFVGVSGVDTVTSGGVYGPLPLVGSSASAPVYATLPALPCAFFVLSTTASFVGSLRSGLIYVGVSTTAFPAGAVRGAFPRVNNGCLLMTAFLSGAQQWPEVVGSPAFGVATVIVDPALHLLTVSLTLSQLVGETSVHIHAGTLFEAGAPVLPLPLGSYGPTVFALTPTLLQTILTGRGYINVHTSLNPVGVWRWQGPSAVLRGMTLSWCRRDPWTNCGRCGGTCIPEWRAGGHCRHIQRSCLCFHECVRGLRLALGVCDRGHWCQFNVQKCGGYARGVVFPPRRVAVR